MAQYFEQYRQSLEKMLYEPGKVNELFTIAETKTGVKRIYIALGMIAVLSIYLVFGYGAQLVCNSIGFIYPAYASVKAIESHKKEDDTKWLTYWVVFAYLSTIEFFSDIFLSWFPLYWLAKCVLLLWCFLPTSWNGSTIIYQRAIRPAFMKYQSRVDTVIDDAADTANRLAAKAANVANRFASDAFNKDN